MKYAKYLAAVALLCAVSAVSYYAGLNSCYEDACHMADLIRCYEDHLNDEDSDIEDYGCFEELEGTFLYDEKTVDLDKYIWCY